MKKHALLILSSLLIGSGLQAQDEGTVEESGGQSRESAAVDPTAAQWSFQFAYEGFLDYKDGEMRDGNPRPPGNEGFIQFRLVAPIPKTEKWPITLLPRLTLRAIENSQNQWGFSQSDLFILGILNDWGTGRFGLGPQFNFPSQGVKDPSVEVGFGPTQMGYGLASAVTQRLVNDKLFLALLLQQTWTAGEINPMGINTIIVYQLGKGWYIGNGDFVISYNWKNGGWRVPFGVRIGKAFISQKSTFNAYIEYQTPLAYKSWIGSVPSHAVRINFQFQIPVGF